jgi:hypothetical protein
MSVQLGDEPAIAAGQAGIPDSPGCWTSDLDRARIAVQLTPEACAEATAFLRIHSAAPGSDVPLEPGAMPRLRREIERCRLRTERHERMVLIEPVPGLDFAQRRGFGWLVARLLGEPLVQNSEGDRVVSVWARPGGKRVIDGARYHQTREGGGPHTDNVSIPDAWEYLVFSCIRPALIGGESILLSALAVHRALEAVPRALDLLRQPFWWEYRGISSGLFQAPVITYDEFGEPRFRHLRKYLESAHQRAGAPLSSEQVWALDTLEAILELTALQFRTRLEQGEILVTHDSQVLHARTFFSDPSPDAPADARDAAAGTCRFFDRVWVKRPS